MVGWAEMPRSPGHVFYDRLQSVLIEGGFDGFTEAACRSYYAINSLIGKRRAILYGGGTSGVAKSWNRPFGMLLRIQLGGLHVDS